MVVPLPKVAGTIGRGTFLVFIPFYVAKISSANYVLTNYESGLAIFSRFLFFANEVVSYQSTSKTEIETRKALIAGIALPLGQGNITVANTHLSWKTEDEPVRLGQVQELLKMVSQKHGAFLLAGDFNDIPQSEPIKEIKNAGYFDLLELLHPGDPNITWDNQNPFIQTHSVKFPDRRIDFLLANQPMLEAHPPQICDVVFTRPNAKGIYPSDHYGVFAEVG